MAPLRLSILTLIFYYKKLEYPHFLDFAQFLAQKFLTIFLSMGQIRVSTLSSLFFLTKNRGLLLSRRRVHEKTIEFRYATFEPRPKKGVYLHLPKVIILLHKQILRKF